MSVADVATPWTVGAEPPILYPPRSAYSRCSISSGDLRRLAATTAERLTQAGLSAKPKTREGHAAGELVAEAEAEKADLIVIGSRGHTGIARLVLGSARALSSPTRTAPSSSSTHDPPRQAWPEVGRGRAAACLALSHGHRAPSAPLDGAPGSRWRGPRAPAISHVSRDGHRAEPGSARRERSSGGRGSARRERSSGGRGRVENGPVTAIENALLVWLVIGIGITAGVFIVARAAVQIAEVSYRVLEQRLDPQVATRQTILLTLAMLLAAPPSRPSRRSRSRSSSAAAAERRSVRARGLVLAAMRSCRPPCFARVSVLS